ncbi:TPA_asm: P7 [Bouteloa betacytorhabdovirus 1]|nr:TPA_asm: P7 [Bouteloa betacytorhabdovirus 1]
MAKEYYINNNICGEWSTDSRFKRDAVETQMMSEWNKRETIRNKFGGPQSIFARTITDTNMGQHIRDYFILEMFNYGYLVESSFKLTDTDWLLHRYIQFWIHSGNGVMECGLSWDHSDTTYKPFLFSNEGGHYYTNDDPSNKYSFETSSFNVYYLNEYMTLNPGDNAHFQMYKDHSSTYIVELNGVRFSSFSIKGNINLVHVGSENIHQWDYWYAPQITTYKRRSYHMDGSYQPIKDHSHFYPYDMETATVGEEDW